MSTWVTAAGYCHGRGKGEMRKREKEVLKGEERTGKREEKINGKAKQCGVVDGGGRKEKGTWEDKHGEMEEGDGGGQKEEEIV